jgi:hypothetical protein
VVVVNPLSIDGAASNEREYAFPVAIGVGDDNARAISTDREAGHAPAVPVRSGMGQEQKCLECDVAIATSRSEGQRLMTTILKGRSLERADH